MNFQKLLTQHVEECINELPSSKAGWVDLQMNTIDYALVSFLRGLNVRYAHEAEAKQAVYDYLDLAINTKQQSLDAEAYFKNQNSKATTDPCYIRVCDCIHIKDAILSKGLDGLILELPNS
jgi:hypothetical protein